MGLGSKRVQALCPRTFDSKYELVSMVGKGSFGEVWRCTDRQTGKQYAGKLISKLTLRTFEERADVEREIAILEMMRGKHEGVVKLKEVMEEDSVLYIVMELCRGGDLFELLNSRGALPEPSARVLFRQLASALAFCHKSGVVHRDIKPENILLTGRGADLYDTHVPNGQAPPVTVKLADFGLATFLGPDEATTGYTGSRYYTAPEMIKSKPYGRSVDVWSLGVVLCTMLTGRMPFAGHNKQDLQGLRRAILRGNIDFKQPAWQSVSDCAKHLVSSMLTLDPTARIDSDEILAHPWLADEDDAEETELIFLAGPTTQSLPNSPEMNQAMYSPRMHASAGAAEVSELRLCATHSHGQGPAVEAPTSVQRSTLEEAVRRLCTPHTPELGAVDTPASGQRSDVRGTLRRLCGAHTLRLHGETPLSREQRKGTVRTPRQAEPLMPLKLEEFLGLQNLGDPGIVMQDAYQPENTPHLESQSPGAQPRQEESLHPQCLRLAKKSISLPEPLVLNQGGNNSKVPEKAGGTERMIPMSPSEEATTNPYSSSSWILPSTLRSILATPALWCFPQLTALSSSVDKEKEEEEGVGPRNGIPTSIFGGAEHNNTQGPMRAPLVLCLQDVRSALQSSTHHAVAC